MGGSRELYVMRHAKSSWDDPALNDHDRPLAPRGRKAAKLIGEHIRNAGIRPDLVLCSSSRRTRETLDALAPGGQTLIERELYDATCDGLIDRLRRVPPEAGSVMLIGHNPAAQDLVLRLAGADRARGSDHADKLAQVQRKFPTGALATLSFDRDWAELGPGCATLLGYVRPKSLA